MRGTFTEGGGEGEMVFRCNERVVEALVVCVASLVRQRGAEESA